MNTLHPVNLSGWHFLRLAEQASGQPAKKKQGGKYQLPCPLRDHSKPGGFVVFPNTGVGYCVKCGQKASQLAMFAGWLHQSESSTREWLRRQRDPAAAPAIPLRQPLVPPASSLPAVSQHSAASSQAIHQVYTRLLELLPLSAEHSAFEQKRGQTATQMAALGYGTLPDGYRRSDRRTFVAAQLAQEFGAAVLAQVPGFYTDQRGGYWTLQGKAGRLIPMRDAQGLIRRLMLNPDKVKPNEGKYRYLATPDQPVQGCPHVAVPNNLTSDRIYLTEGPRKADIAAARLGATVVGCMGVSGRSHAYTELLAYCGNQRPTVVLAFDRDAAGKGAAKLAAAELSGLGFAVLQASWPDDYKGLDDALLAGAELSHKLVGGRGLARLDPELLAAIEAATPQPEYVSIEAARDFNHVVVSEMLAGLRQGDAGGRVVVLTSTTGTGKSAAAKRALAELEAAGWPSRNRTRRKEGGGVVTEQQPARVAVMVDQRQQVNQWWEELAALGLDVAPLIGRVQSPAPPAYVYAECNRANRIAELAARHQATDQLCGPHATDHECQAQAMHAAALGSGDLLAAKIVVATKASLLNEGPRLAEFDLIIVDETVDQHLYSVQPIVEADLVAWWSGMEQHRDLYPDHCPQRQLWNTLYLAAFAYPTNERQPLLAALLVVRPDVADLLAVCAAEEAEQHRHGLPFEQRHSALTADGHTEVIPLVYWRELVGELQRLATDPSTPNTLWLDTAAISCYRVNQSVINLLTATEHSHRLNAIILDATPSPLLAALLPHAERRHAGVKQHLQITQITDSLLTSRHLSARGGGEAKRLAQAINALAGECATTAVLGHKGLLQAGGAVEVELGDLRWAMDVGWFGRDETAHNRWTAVRRLVIAGHHQLPPTEVQARAAMLCRYAGSGKWKVESGEKIEVKEQQAEAELRVLRPYNYGDADGIGYGYWMRTYHNPLEQAIALHSEQATIMQAVGRVRGALAEPGQPVEVYLLTATPVADLQVDRLCSLDDIIAEGGQATAPTTRPANSALAALNQQRHDEAWTKLDAAWADGNHQPGKLAAATGCHPATIASYIAQQSSNGGGITLDAEIVISSLCAAPNIAPRTESVLVASWRPMGGSQPTEGYIARE